MSRRVDLTNQSFGGWKVIEYSHSDKKHTYWECHCNCGTEKTVRADMLKDGRSQSCGRCKRNTFVTKNSIIIGYTEKGEKFIIDADDLEKVEKYCWYKDINGYITTRINGRVNSLHTIILKRNKGCVIDHVNRDTSDNRKSNLRICTQQQNTFNQGLSRNNTSGFKGVTRKNNKWVAQIMHNRRYIYLGIFNSLEEAANAYNAKAKELFGEFAYLNRLTGNSKGGGAYAK